MTAHMSRPYRTTEAAVRAARAELRDSIGERDHDECVVLTRSGETIRLSRDGKRITVMDAYPGHHIGQNIEDADLPCICSNR